MVFRYDATPTGPLSPQDHLLFMLFVGGVRSQFLDIYSNFNILQSHPTVKLAGFCHKDEHPSLGVWTGEEGTRRGSAPDLKGASNIRPGKSSNMAGISFIFST
jgi:hypothetical protein